MFLKGTVQERSTRSSFTQEWTSRFQPKRSTSSNEGILPLLPQRPRILSTERRLQWMWSSNSNRLFTKEGYLQ